MTTTVAATPDFEQVVLGVLKADIEGAAAAPLLSLLQALLANKGNTPAQVAAWLSFVATLPMTGIQLGLEVETQILTTAITKLQAVVAAKPAA